MDAGNPSGCSSDSTHAISGLSITVTAGSSGEEREIDGRVKIHLDATNANGNQAMACLTVKCAGASFGSGGPDWVQTVSNVVDGEASRVYRVRGLVELPTQGQSYACSMYLSAESSGGLTGNVVMDYIDSTSQYGTLAATSAVNSALSEHCLHRADVRTGDCYDNWANYNIDDNGDQGITADASGDANVSHRTDVKLENVPVGTELTFNSTVFVTTCNVAGYLACPTNRGSGDAALTSTIKQLVTSGGCGITLTLSQADPAYDRFNGTDTATVTTAQHHGVIFAQKKVTVTGPPASSCSIKVWSETTTSGRSVNVHGMHTRLYTVA